LVLEDPIEEFVTGDHNGKPRSESPSRLARGSGEALLPGNDSPPIQSTQCPALHALYQQGIRFTSPYVAIAVSF